MRAMHELIIKSIAPMLKVANIVMDDDNDELSKAVIDSLSLISQAAYKINSCRVSNSVSCRKHNSNDLIDNIRNCTEQLGTCEQN